MKTKMKRFFFTVILCAPMIFILAQNNFGVKLNAGVSTIKYKFDQTNIDYKNSLELSGQIGVFGEISIGKKSKLGSEITFSQIEGAETSSFEVLGDYGYPTGTVGYLNTRNNIHISYLTFPLYYGYKIDKMTINGGFQVAAVIFSSEVIKSTYTISGDITNYTQKQNDMNIDWFDFGPRIGIIYDLNSRLSIEGTYYHGINNIIKENEAFASMRIQQATIGLRYKLLTGK